MEKLILKCVSNYNQLLKDNESFDEYIRNYNFTTPTIFYILIDVLEEYIKDKNQETFTIDKESLKKLICIFHNIWPDIITLFHLKWQKSSFNHNSEINDLVTDDNYSFTKSDFWQFKKNIEINLNNFSHTANEKNLNTFREQIRKNNINLDKIFDIIIDNKEQLTLNDIKDFFAAYYAFKKVGNDSIDNLVNQIKSSASYIQYEQENINNLAKQIKDEQDQISELQNNIYELENQISVYKEEFINYDSYVVQNLIYYAEVDSHLTTDWLSPVFRTIFEKSYPDQIELVKKSNKFIELKLTMEEQYEFSKNLKAKKNNLEKLILKFKEEIKNKLQINDELINKIIDKLEDKLDQESVDFLLVNNFIKGSGTIAKIFSKTDDNVRTNLFLLKKLIINQT